MHASQAAPRDNVIAAAPPHAHTASSAPRKAIPPAPSAQIGPEHTDQAPSDGVEVLRGVLEGQYAVDAMPTREALERERLVSRLFADAKLESVGQLQQVTCRENICRGIARIVSESADNQFFGRSLLSGEFALAIPDAVSVTSRERLSDGSVVATFYIHPQEIFDMMPRSELE
jgi:hypothetical protein